MRTRRFHTVLRFLYLRQTGISQKLHVKHDKPLHPESQKEHRERAGTIGEQQELGTTHPEAEQGLGAGGALGGPSAGPTGVGGPPRTL